VALWVAAGSVILLPSVVCAQSAIERAMAQADSLNAVQGDSSVVVEAVADTILTVPSPAGPPWWDPLRPTLDGRVTSDVSRGVLNGGIEAPIGRLIPGWQGRARYTGTQTEFRQFDRESTATNLNLSVNGSAGVVGELDFEALRNTSYDENRLSSGQVLVLEQDTKEVHASLAGGLELENGTRFAWGARGDAEDVQRTDRGVANDRDLLGGAVRGTWGTRGPWHDFSARYGYDVRGGERALRDRVGDALSERDTLWARGQVDVGLRLNLSMDARRTTFVENRLDFTRNQNGVVDTLGVLEPVGDEHESTWENSWSVDLRTRPFPRLAVNAQASQRYSESSYTLSRAGLVQLRNDQLATDAVIRYAEAGSLRVSYTYSDRANDRRPLGSGEFRGEEARVSQTAQAEFRHKASDIIDLHLDLQQTLDQNINEAPDNLTDVDRLSTRGDLKLLSDPWDWLQIEAAGAYSVEEEINIDAARVNSNQVMDLYEVRGNFIVDPPGGWRFIQNYSMRIQIFDRVVGIEDDRFNKNGVWDNRAEYRFANGVFTDAQYIVDYRRNGRRDRDRPDDEVYIYQGARRDHRLLFGIRIPIGVAELEARTERGFLRDDSGFAPVSEDRGKITFGLRGNWQFWANRGTLTVNAQRIAQFGPRVRAETEDYWVMNTSLRVAF
jgi:hypothetical protein